jgi:hypothetical protein
VAAAGAELALNAGHPEVALARVTPAIEKARAIGGIYGEAVAQRIWGQALAMTQPNAAEEVDLHLARALELFLEGGCKLEAAHTHAAWGALLGERGEVTLAADHLAHAAELFTQAGLGDLAQRAAADGLAVGKEAHAKA